MGPRKKFEGPKPSLANLPRDVLVRITDLLAHVSPSSLTQLGSVSSLFHDLARYHQHARIKLDLSAEGLSRRRDFIKRAGLEAAVRTVELVDTHDPDAAYVQRVRTVCRFLESLSGLRSIEYDGPDVPQEVLTVLEQRPHVALSASYPGPRSAPPREDLVCRLKGCVNLRSLDVAIIWTQIEECRRLTRHLKKLLLSCRNLRVLTLDISQARDGWNIFRPGPEYVGLGFKDGEALPPLESLTLRSYPFGHQRREGVGVGVDFSCQGYPGSGWEMDQWADTFDWSRLKILRTGQQIFARKACMRFIALEEVYLSEHCEDEEVLDFFAGIPSQLRAIAAPSLAAVGMGNLLRHAPSLEWLELHQGEGYRSDWSTGCIDLNSLRQIRSRCARLQHLSLDLDRAGAWPYRTFEELARFPTLETADLWFELGDATSKQSVQPALTMKAAEDIFRYVLSSRPSGATSRLRRLTLHVGEYGMLAGGVSGGPIKRFSWAEHNSMSFICEMSERDVDAAQDVFSISCPKLDQLERVLEQTRRRQSFMSQIRSTLVRAVSSAERAKAREEAVWLWIAKQRRDEAWLVSHEGPQARTELFVRRCVHP